MGSRNDGVHITFNNYICCSNRIYLRYDLHRAKIKKIAYRIIFDYDYLLKYEDKKDPETLKRIMDEVFDDYDNMNQ